MKISKSGLLKPLLFAVSVVFFAIVKFHRSGENKKTKKISKKVLTN